MNKPSGFSDMWRASLLVLALLVIAPRAVSAPATGNGAISINFVGRGTAMGSTETAGVVPKASWNNASGAKSSSPLALLDETGAGSGASATWSSDNIWSTGILDQAGNNRMMKGYLDNGNLDPTTVTVSGLNAGTYDVYIYVDGDNPSTTRTGVYQLSGSGITTTSVNLTDPMGVNFSGTFAQASNSTGNFVKFAGVYMTAGFTLTATPGPASDSGKRAPVNGIQIIPSSSSSLAADFTLSASPNSQTVTPGGKTSYTVNVGGLNGFTGTVGLSVSGVPVGASASFSPTSISGSGSATLNVSTTTNTSAGTSTLTITGSSGSLIHSTTVGLVVNATQTFSISGTISGSGGNGATVVLSGAASASTTANSSGSYTFTGLANGTYAVTPSHSGFNFSPTVQSVTINGGNATVPAFSATVASPTFSISGTITPAATGSGASVTLSGAAVASTTANSSGAFSFTGLANGSYTVTPSSSGATFSPTSQNVVINGANGSVSFTATATSSVIFFDDFTGGGLGSSWTALSRHGDYSNSELQCYLPANDSVSGGFLTITSLVQTQTCGDADHSASSWSYTSGMVQWNSFNFTYGTVEFRAKMAGGQGTWPAIWLLGANCQASNVLTADNTGSCNWPQPGSDEIDITEIKGGSLTTVWQNVISGGSGFQTCTPSTTDVSQNYHVYDLIWSAGSLIWKIDGVQTCRFTSGIPSNPMFLMINTAIGGAGGTVNNSTLPQTLSVDYVKVTQP
jgi:hypothetical protein